MTAKKPKHTVHAHGCVRCNLRYEDTCDTTETDALCKDCRGIGAWQLLLESALPRACCVETSRMARKEEIKTYRLAGKKIWYICRTCSRTHPYKPLKEGRP